MTAASDFLSLCPSDVSVLEFVRIATPYVAASVALGERVVLDVGSGPGYGSLIASLSKPRLFVTCDIDTERLPLSDALAGPAAAKSCLMDAGALAVRVDSFDVVLMFEVIEHVPSTRNALRELRRVSRSATGLVLMSTPNRRTRLLPFERPWDEEHMLEWSPRRFRSELKRHFASVVILGIYGDGPLHDQYLESWRPSLVRVYRKRLRPLLGRLIGARRLQRLTRVIRRGSSTEDAVVRPGATATSVGNASVIAVPSELGAADWPFFVAPRTKGCLNTFAVCGDDAHVVESTALQIVSAFEDRTSGP